MSVFRCFLVAVLVIGAFGATSTPAPTPAPGSFPVCDLCNAGGANFTIKSPGTLVYLTGFTPTSCLSYYQQAIDGSINPAICPLIAAGYSKCKCIIATSTATTSAPSPGTTTATTTPSAASASTSAPVASTSAPVSAPVAPTAPSAPVTPTAPSAPVKTPVAPTSPKTPTSGGMNWFPASLVLGITLLVGTVAVL